MTAAENSGVVLRTPRLILRPWRDEDVEPFAAMNADPRVMEHFPSLMDREQTEAMVARIRTHFAAHGFGPWAVEVPGAASFIGFTGIFHVPFEAYFTPAIEVGWRLTPAHWGQGYATEAAQAVLQHGFERLALPEIVAYTVPANVRSRRVMEKLGMKHEPAGDFDHPRIAEGSPARRQVLYRISPSMRSIMFPS
jgi:ribosomal-protein-alanine N-acetyltransferase